MDHRVFDGVSEFFLLPVLEGLQGKRVRRDGGVDEFLVELWALTWFLSSVGHQDTLARDGLIYTAGELGGDDELTRAFPA